MYDEVFKTIAEEDRQFVDEEDFHIYGFGNSKTSYEEVRMYLLRLLYGLRQANLVLIACASSEGSGIVHHHCACKNTFGRLHYFLLIPWTLFLHLCELSV